MILRTWSSGKSMKADLLSTPALLTAISSFPEGFHGARDEMLDLRGIGDVGGYGFDTASDVLDFFDGLVRGASGLPT